MILKTLNYRKNENNGGVYEEWSYYDNINSASTYYNESARVCVVECDFRDGNRITFPIHCVAYLMSDSGKTIDKILGASVEELGDTKEAVYSVLQDAEVKE